MHRPGVGASIAGDSNAAALRNIGVDAIGSEKKIYFYISICIYISIYTYLSIPLCTCTRACIATRECTRTRAPAPPRGTARTQDRDAHECASPTSRRPLVEGAHGTARPQPRRRRGRRREDTRRRPANDSRGAGGQRASAARPPPDHEPKHHPQEAESDRGGTPVRFSNFRSNFCSFFNFRSIVFAQGTSAAAPAPESFLVCFVCLFCYRFSILCLAKRRFRRPFDLCVIACVRFRALGVHRLAPDSVHPSYVCVFVETIFPPKNRRAL